ncbi:uncharacterized protein N7483_009214 [Penicillium malachiteum]|uniref:uncharacterized protein n=1 Tax=Penicillium malachiteum TaxID=1324776 RepID=UPI00254680E4|nr:uncharacterized protein N7483_009214 [Penicillium malachiteum]KAJ5721280.1 hypothetical protein N7483_009214 [Penicillium malachiteum]
MRSSISINSAAQAYMLCLGLFSPFISALSTNVDRIPNLASPINNDITLRHRSTDNSTFLLRLMSLGASITNGYLSTDGNGYRDWIRQELRYEGWDVEMIGSLRNGTMVDNFNEGHFGFRVDQLPAQAEKSIPDQPNLILINAGTDDALQDHKISTTGDRMNSLLDLLFKEIPGTTIILSTLLPNKDVPDLVQDISEQYRELAAKRRDNGDRVVLAEMSYFITTNELADATHPDDEGYKKMASVWWAAIKEALKEDMIQKFNYTISNLQEKKLDNKTTNPDLPSYTAPAQPTQTTFISSASMKLQQPLLLVLALQFLIVYSGFL